MLFGLEVLAAFLILQFSLSAPQMLTYLFEWRGGTRIGRADWLSGWGCREFATRYEVQVRQTAPGDNACPPKSDHRAHTCTWYICWFAGWLAFHLCVDKRAQTVPQAPHPEATIPSGTEFHSRSVCFCPRSAGPSGFFPPPPAPPSATHLLLGAPVFWFRLPWSSPLPPRPRRTRLQPSAVISAPCPFRLGDPLSPAEFRILPERLQASGSFDRQAR